jgi:primosomal protein N''
MKTLIIAGTYYQTTKRVENTSTFAVHYKVALFGQTKEQPLMQYVGEINQELTGFDQLQEVARAKYAKWFNTDLFNIVSMEVLTPTYMSPAEMKLELARLESEGEKFFTNI